MSNLEQGLRRVYNREPLAICGSDSYYEIRVYLDTYIHVIYTISFISFRVVVYSLSERN